MFILVRHAVAVGKHEWPRADLVRPLERTGLRQAASLVPLLASNRVTRLLSSPTVRCRSTLAPASSMLGIRVESSGLLAVHAPVAGLLDLLGSTEVDGAALCTHGETFAALSRAWRGTWPGTADAPDVADTPKGGSWLISDYGTPHASAEYLGVADDLPESCCA